MAYKVLVKGKYWEERESFRDPVTGKPRSRFLRYIGKRNSDPQARMAQMVDTAERKGAAIDEAQRAMNGETNAERQAREREEAKFSQEKFLEETKGPALPTSTDTADNSSEEKDPPAYTSEMSEPDAPAGSDDASGSSSLE